ncbi:DnaB-like helicase C-terminal domain-containing protein [Candidatus Ruminimicrobium bovinum]|uniref:DnaB-like helicase C-terminal domain-containing protein n=1 Tax=Candidatus Ruminimicrobium bovinum TaxID=3242779 RepID=UPI0039B85AD0
MKEMQEIVKELKNAKIVSIIGKVGTGKTTLATNIIKEFITDTKVKRNVAIYSLETTSVVLLSLITQMKGKKLNVFINKTDFDTNKEIDEETSKGFFYIYDGESVKTGKIKQQIDSLIEELKKRKQKLDLILIDYLQLTYPSTDNLYIDTKDKKGQELKENYDVLIKQFADTNLNEIMETNIKQLKEIAKNYNIPIILVTMLSDNKEQETEQKKVIKEICDIVIEIEKQEDNSQIKITDSKNNTKIINCKFDNTSCEFIEIK